MISPTHSLYRLVPESRLCPGHWSVLIASAVAPSLLLSLVIPSGHCPVDDDGLALVDQLGVAEGDLLVEQRILEAGT